MTKSFVYEMKIQYVTPWVFVEGFGGLMRCLQKFMSVPRADAGKETNGRPNTLWGTLARGICFRNCYGLRSLKRILTYKYLVLTQLLDQKYSYCTDL
jgi:hypothetical protein